MNPAQLYRNELRRNGSDNLLVGVDQAESYGWYWSPEPGQCPGYPHGYEWTTFDTAGELIGVCTWPTDPDSLPHAWVKPQ